MNFFSKRGTEISKASKQGDPGTSGKPPLKRIIPWVEK